MTQSFLPVTDEQQDRLWQVLQEPSADGDLWDGPKVDQWMSELLWRPIHPQRGWEYLKVMQMHRRRPRPAYEEREPDTQSESKTANNIIVFEKVKAEHPQAEVELYPEDVRSLLAGYIAWDCIRPIAGSGYCWEIGSQKRSLAPSYCPRRQPSKYRRRSSVSLPSSGWGRCGSTAP